MLKEEKLILARQVMQISGIFTLVVAGLLLINFLQLSKYEPLESETLTRLVEQLKEDPRNDQLREEIRDFDLMVRKAYFTSEWQVRTGALLLLIGGIVFSISLKVYTDIKRSILEPENQKEDFFQARKNAWRLLLGLGVLLFGLAFIASISSTNYLENYFPENQQLGESLYSDNTIEVINIVDTSGNAAARTMNQAGGIVDGTGNSAASANNESPENVQISSGNGGSPNMGSQQTAGSGPAAQTGQSAPEKIYGLAEFKKQHNSFRGPMGLGISYHKNIPTDWDGASGKNLLWKVAITKPGYNSPVIWGDKIFIAGGDAEARIVSCFNRNSGQLLWERKADNIPGSPASMPKVTEDTGLSAPTMAVDGHRVYAIFATGDVIAFDLNGNRTWARNLGVPRNHYGHSSSLLVWDGKLIIQYDTGRGGRMLALNGKSGETVWDVKRDNTISWASPILIEVDGKMQVVTNTDPNVAGHDVKTGEEIWKLPVMMGEVGPSCAYEDGLVFANNEYASLVAINPEPGAEVKWESYDYLSEAASPVAYNGLLYLATSYGVFVCYDSKSGQQVWEKDFGVTLYSSPMIVEGKIYLMDNQGVMHIMKADRSATVLGQPALGEASYAIPAFAEGRIYIRGDKNLYCFGK